MGRDGTYLVDIFDIKLEDVFRTDRDAPNFGTAAKRGFWQNTPEVPSTEHRQSVDPSIGGQRNHTKTIYIMKCLCMSFVI